MSMASKAKPWRDAATLILTAHISRTAAGSKTTSPKSSQTFPGTADAGSIKKEKQSNVPSARKKIIPVMFDYSTLLLTRNVRRNTFFAGSHVFPGGAIDKADFSPSWMDLFGKAGFQHPADFGQLISLHKDRPPVLQNKTHTSIPAEVAFRICAIRESFEESGILLLRSIQDCSPELGSMVKTDETAVPFGRVFHHVNLTDTEVKSWRNLVHQNASEFLQLCQTFQVLPDIWALAEWSNWLTPSDNKKRFDTMFYMCSLDAIPATQHDEKETIQSQWMTPTEALTKYVNEELYLPPPQLYELQRMCNYEQQRALHQFASDRSFRGCQRYLPVRCNSRDGLISLLPGDELYPENPVLHHLKPDEILTTEQTMDESSVHCQHLHRMEFRTVSDYQLLCNVKLPYGHIDPKQMFEEDNIGSKL